MGGGKGSSAPPPPPDYSRQIRNESNRIEAGYQREADSYNQNVNKYNNALENSRDAVYSLGDNISGLGIEDAQGDNLSSFRNKLTNLRRNTPDTSVLGYDSTSTSVDRSSPAEFVRGGPGKFGGIFNDSNYMYDFSVDDNSFVQGRPDFQTSQQHGTYGTIPLDPPSLSSPNKTLRQNVMGQTQSLSQQLDQLEQERQQEESRVRNFRNSMLTNANTYGTTIDQLGIGDKEQLNEAERKLSEYDSKRQTFSSPIMDQLYPNGFEQIDQRFDEYGNTLSDLRDQRQQEKQRISGFRDQLLGSVDNYRDQVSNLGIGDIEQVNELGENLRGDIREARRFDSPLNYDFSNELQEAQGISSRIQELRNQREAEQQRIQSTQQDLLSTARGANRAIENTGVYSAGGISAIGDEISDIRNRISQFDTPLEADFSGVQSRLENAESNLSGLRERRTNRLDDIASRIAPATEGLSDVELSNVDALNERSSQLSSVQNDLSRFSGGQVDGIRDQLSAATEQVDARLQELSDYRANVESRAQELLESVKNASYRQPGDVAGDESGIESLRQEAELYEAQQAMDEIDAITERLNSERSRLAADAEAVQRRNEAAQQNTSIPTNGLGGVDSIDAAEYARRYNLTADEEEEMRQRDRSRSPFSQSLGVIRVR